MKGSANKLIKTIHKPKKLKPEDECRFLEEISEYKALLRGLKMEEELTLHRRRISKKNSKHQEIMAEAKTEEKKEKINSSNQEN